MTSGYLQNHPNSSQYTLRTIHDDDGAEVEVDVSTPLPSASPTTPNYGTIFPLRSPGVPSIRRPLFNAALKMAVLFVVSTLVLGGTLWLALPTLDEADRPLLRIPKSFDQLKELNALLKKYRDIYPYRIVICWTTTYLFLQAFSLPGSMYLSILGGAVWGVWRAIPMACTAVATGATLCYLISAALGPALLALPKFKERLDRWAEKVDAQRANLISFLIVIRIAPFPPHWVVNVICPHVGIGIPIFWMSTWFGILGVTIIHTTIGSGLDEMTSAADFHLISWRNFFGLALIVVAVLIPVGLRFIWKKELRSIAETDAPVPGDEQPVEAPLIDFTEDDEDYEDVILQAGPTVVNKGKQLTTDEEAGEDTEAAGGGESSEEEDEVRGSGKGRRGDTRSFRR
ncbi:oxalate transporter [Hysterangium stoloniferum]|nr:oxalate transporter [Hysterangium stoloniferum]